MSFQETLGLIIIGCSSRLFLKDGVRFSSMAVDLVVKNAKLVTPRGVIEGALISDKGSIVGITKDSHLPQADNVIDAKGNPVLPGPIDGHCHHTSPPDIPETSSKAGAKGGFTSLLDMPGPEIPTFNREEYLEKKKLFEGNCFIDYTLHGAAASGYPSGSLSDQIEEGATGIKFFVSSAGPGWPQTFDGEIIKGFKEIAAVNGLALVHAENDQIIRDNFNRLKAEGRKDFPAYLEERPKIAEVEAGRRVIQYLEETGCRGLIVHTSIPDTVYRAAEARIRGAKVRVETCPQYLYLTQDDVKEKGPWAKFAPPARDKETVRKIRELLGSGWIDIVATDHAPHSKEDKMAGLDDILNAPNGIPGLDHFLSLMLNGVNEGWMSLERLAAVTSENPAKIFGLYPKKGALRVGSDADLVIVDLDKEVIIRNQDQITACGWTPYDGFRVKGAPILSTVRGKIVMEAGKVVGEKGYGEYISRI
jgi:dihydroorotase (multifunctional complex type)